MKNKEIWARSWESVALHFRGFPEGFLPINRTIWYVLGVIQAKHGRAALAPASLPSLDEQGYGRVAPKNRFIFEFRSPPAHYNRT